jgi:predicted transcriptional regulator
VPYLASQYLHERTTTNDPGWRLEDSGSSAGSLWPTLEELARPAREKRRLNPAVRDQLITELCSRTPLSVRELAQLLDRTEAYTGDAIRPLLEVDRLTFLYPGQPRHPKQRYLTPNSPAADQAEQIRAGEIPVAGAASVLSPGVEGTVVSHLGAGSAAANPESDVASRIWTQLERSALVARERRRLAPAVRDRLVLELCSMAPLSARELGVLLNRSEAYVADAIHPLVTAGELGFLYPDQPRHPRQKYVSRTRVPVAEILPVAEVSGGQVAPDLADKEDLERLGRLAQVRWSELDQLASSARDNRSLGRAELVNLIEAIGRVAPVSVRELAVLTDRREEYIREVLDGLRTAGRLRSLYPVEPTHAPQKYLAVATTPEPTGHAIAKVVQAVDGTPPELRQTRDAGFDPASGLFVPEVPLTAKPGPPPGRIEPPARPLENDTAGRPPRIGASTWNPATNSIVTVLTGILFGITLPPAWWFYSLLVAAGLAALHVVTGSTQYQRYQALDPSPGRKASFLVLKGMVAFVEIILVTLVVSLIHC